MNWKLKAKVFRALEAVPFGSALHYQLQRRITSEWPRPAPALDQMLVAAQRVSARVASHRGQFLEIGSGRDLAVAVALRMLGVQHVTCVDVARLARPQLIAHAAKHIARRLGVAVPKVGNWSDIEAFGITYVAPTLLQSAQLQPRSFDCFYSIDTLEHIPLRELAAVLACARALLKPSGVSLHLIDYSDHYARSDNGLSRFNFLTFTEEEWSPFNSRLHFVNRLRHSDYLRLFDQAGLRVIHAEPEREPLQQPILAKLAPQFRHLEATDLFTIRALIVASPNSR